MHNNYLINLHAHTYFSDGHNSPLAMAIAAKHIGFTSLVITDHCSSKCNTLSGLDTKKFDFLKFACKEAKKILPVIIGIELAIGGEEVLVFGSAMINKIMDTRDNGTPVTIDHLIEWKPRHYSAFILCHPHSPENWERLKPILDGYEEFNSGDHMFANGRDHHCLTDLVGWANSDAHQVANLGRSYNKVHSKITIEQDLIQYIKRGFQPTLVVTK